MVQTPLLALSQLGIQRGSGRILRGYVGYRKTRRGGFWRNHLPGRGGERKKGLDWPGHRLCTRRERIEGRPLIQDGRRQLESVNQKIPQRKNNKSKNKSKSKDIEGEKYLHQL